MPWITARFAAEPELQSALFAVAQYWADEADDAVHACVVFSKAPTPAWPHLCRWDREDEGLPGFGDGETCTSCGDSTPPLPFHDNGDAITGFQSMCREDASQESATSEAYLPYAIARRDADGGVTLEIVAGYARAWLDRAGDAPTPDAPPPSEDDRTRQLFELVAAPSSADVGPAQVLADHLLAEGDPLGKHIALALAARAADMPARRAELEREAAALAARHAGAWLGPLAALTTPEGVSFVDGIVRGLAVYLADPDAARAVADARAWRTVERLRFLAESAQMLSPAMRALRDVGPLDADGLDHLARVGGGLPLERVHVALANEAMIGALAAITLPRLRTLGIGSAHGGPGLRVRQGRNPFTGEAIQIPGGSPGTAALGPGLLAPLRAALWWPALDELVLASVDPETIAAWLAVPVGAGRPPGITFTGVSPAYEPCGIQLTVRGDRATIAASSFGSEVDAAALIQMIGALPDRVRAIEVRPSTWFAPTDEDVAMLAREIGRSVERAV